MQPQIHIGFLILDSFITLRFVAIAATACIFWWQWNEDKNLGRHRWKAAFLVMSMTFVAGVVGSWMWHLFRAEVIGTIWGDPFYLNQASAWYFAGFIAALLGAAITLKLVRTSVWRGLDLLAPGIAIGHGLQRIGCFLAGDGCYGYPTELPWGMAFPNGSVPIHVPVHPTMLYEAILMTFLFIFLWKKRGTWPEGVSFAICLVTVGVSIFSLHFIHLAPKVIWGLTEAQLFSLLLVPFGGWILMKTLHRPRIALRGLRA